MQTLIETREDLEQLLVAASERQREEEEEAAWVAFEITRRLRAYREAA